VIDTDLFIIIRHPESMTPSGARLEMSGSRGHIPEERLREPTGLRTLGLREMRNGYRDGAPGLGPAH
jgi:hypothetical protein